MRLKSQEPGEVAETSAKPETDAKVSQTALFPELSTKPKNKGGRPPKANSEKSANVSSELPPEKQKRFLALLMVLVDKIFGFLAYFGAPGLSAEERAALEELFTIEVGFWEETALTRFRTILRISLVLLLVTMFLTRIYHIIKGKRKAHATPV